MVHWRVCHEVILRGLCLRFKNRRRLQRAVKPEHVCPGPVVTGSVLLRLVSLRVATEPSEVYSIEIKPYPLLVLRRVTLIP